MFLLFLLTKLRTSSSYTSQGLISRERRSKSLKGMTLNGRSFTNHRVNRPTNHALSPTLHTPCRHRRARPLSCHIAASLCFSTLVPRGAFAIDTSFFDKCLTQMFFQLLASASVKRITDYTLKSETRAAWLAFHAPPCSIGVESGYSQAAAVFSCLCRRGGGYRVCGVELPHRACCRQRQRGGDVAA